MPGRLSHVRTLFRRPAVRVGAVVVGLGLSGLVAVTLTSGREADRQWQQAEEALGREDLPAACDHLQAFVADRPASAEGIGRDPR